MNRLKWKKKQKSKSKIKFSKGGDERSYPASEVRGSGWEELPHGPKPKARAAAGRRYPTPPGPRPWRWPGGATPCPRPGVVAGRTNPTSKEPWQRGRRRA